MNVQLRFRDADAYGHVNNAVYSTWAESARIALARDIDPPLGDLILARIEIDFIAQVQLTHDVTVQTWLERIGTTSMHVAHRIMAGGTLAASVGTVVVLYDYQAMSKRPFTTAERTALKPYLAAPTGDA
jgi:acyl-CoA thioester hydrolase